MELNEQEAKGFMALCRKIYDVMIEDVGTEESATVIMEMEMGDGPALQVHFTTVPEGGLEILDFCQQQAKLNERETDGL